MINNRIRNIVSKSLRNLPGWRTDKKLIVFESDDWGSIRMPSNSSFKRLERLGLDLRSADAERYNLNDTLATHNDLVNLFDVLARIKDSNGNYAVFTPVTIVANPDFKRIKESGFRDYFYEPFTDTLKRHEGCERSFVMWETGIKSRLFVPQMHGREHLNVIAWLNALKLGEKKTLAAFEEGMWGFVPDDYPGTDYQAAFLLAKSDDINYQETILTEGLELFRNLMGYNAEYFVPPNGVFNNKLNKILSENGIKFRYAPRIQNETLGSSGTKMRVHWLGKKDSNGIIYNMRNCFFEPSKIGRNWVDSCLDDIKNAFRLHKPAVISTHRVNYVGALKPTNRDNGLRQLEQLLHAIMKNWPDSRFVTTMELYNFITNR